jgi:hypothetical protein
MPADNSRERREQRKQEALQRNAKSDAAMYSCGHKHGIRKGCKGARRAKRLTVVES